MKLGMQVGLGPGHIVLNVDPAPPKGAQPTNFWPMSVVANGWMDEDATWCGGRPWPRRHFVRWGPSSPLQKGGIAPRPIFGPYLLWPNGCVDQHATWYGGTHRLRPLCQMGTPLPSQKGAEHFPNFRPMSIVTKRLDASRCRLIWK